jgi:hypothetical protein
MREKLIQHLSHELWQTEVSASQHCKREAERLGDTPPARAMLQAALHADAVLEELPKLAFERQTPLGGVGAALGKIFSEVRDTVADKLLTSERSYRGTLLGLRHGVDLVQLMAAAVDDTNNRELRDFCERWLQRRTSLVDSVAAQLRWFAGQSEQALKPARGLFTARRVSAPETPPG